MERGWGRGLECHHRAMQTYGLLIFRNLTPFAFWADLVRRAKKQVKTAKQRTTNNQEFTRKLFNWYMVNDKF
jgi:hypothetical protein